VSPDSLEPVTPVPALQRPDLVVRRPAGFWRRHALGTLALVTGIAGLAAAVLPPVWIDPPPRSVEVKHLVLEVVLRRPAIPYAAYQAALRDWQRVAAVLGLVAVVLGALAGIRRQHRGLVTFALGLGAAALLWQYIVVAVIAAIIVMALVAAHS
jgi:ferric-dicitrate binding protein FerR (iron transport regulator)